MHAADRMGHQHQERISLYDEIPECWRRTRIEYERIKSVRREKIQEGKRSKISCVMCSLMRSILNGHSIESRILEANSYGKR